MRYARRPAWSANQLKLSVQLKLRDPWQEAIERGNMSEAKLQSLLLEGGYVTALLRFSRVNLIVKSFMCAPSGS